MILDPRGPNVIPFGRRTLDMLRRANQDRPAPVDRPLPLSVTPAEKPRPFNCLGDPIRVTLPPVAADRFPGVRLQDETFSFNNVSDNQFNIELEIEGALADHRLAYPKTTPLEFVTALLRVTKKLLRMARLPQ